jgi:hypothetical protein
MEWTHDLRIRVASEIVKKSIDHYTSNEYKYGALSTIHLVLT